MSFDVAIGKLKTLVEEGVAMLLMITLVLPVLAAAVVCMVVAAGAEGIASFRRRSPPEGDARNAAR
jgi:hypothetical protein